MVSQIDILNPFTLYHLIWRIKTVSRSGRYIGRPPGRIFYRFELLPFLIFDHPGIYPFYGNINVNGIPCFNDVDGLGRILIIYGGMPFPPAVTTVYYVMEAIAVLFLLNDIRKGNNIKPFLTINIILILNHICWAFQGASWWQSFAKWFVSATF